jgi:hypothetical protein
VCLKDDIVVCWKDEIVVCWKDEIVVCWKYEIIVCWKDEIVVCWKAEIVACWKDEEFQASTHHPPITDGVKIMYDELAGDTEVLGKPSPVSLCSPQIQHDLTRAKVGSWRVTARETAHRRGRQGRRSQCQLLRIQGATWSA